MYQLKFEETAVRELKMIDHIYQKVIKKKLLILSENPEKLKNNITPLKGQYKGKYRLRVGDYRIIYQIKNKELIILIIRIRHRREIYG